MNIEPFQIYFRKYVCYGAGEVSRYCTRYRNACCERACDRKRRKGISGSMEIHGIQRGETLQRYSKNLRLIFNRQVYKRVRKT